MKIIRILALFIGACLFKVITFFVPKKRNLWLFGAWKGYAYSDNSKYLFEYVNENQKSINAVWVTKKKSIACKLEKEGYKVLTYPSFKALFAIARASTLFQTEANQDIFIFRPSRATIVQLWHGVAAGKNMQWNKNSLLKNLIIDFIWADYKKSYWMAASPKYIETHSRLLRVPYERFRLTGTPREDAFYKNEESALIRELRERYPNCKIVAYLPTHRMFGATAQLSDNIERMIQLDGFFGDNNIVILFKPHSLEKDNCRIYREKCQNIYFAIDEEYDDIYSYIGQTDMLVSDYSSIVYDYLLCEKPIILFTYDLERYRMTDGGITDIFEEMPVGPFCFSWEEVVQEINKMVCGDQWGDARLKNKELFFSFSDGNNCERVYQEVVRINMRRK